MAKTFEAERILRDLPSNYNAFPSIAEIEKLIWKLQKNKEHYVKKNEEEKWSSKQAYGTPAHCEAIFMMIEKGKTSGAGWDFARSRMKMSDDILWQAYEMWKEGRVHPEIEKIQDLKFTSKWRRDVND